MTWSMRTNRDGADLEQPRQDLRDLDAGEAAFAGLGVVEAHRDREAERRDVRERVARVDRERRQDREDLVEEPLSERLVVLGDRGVVEELDALGRERAPDLEEDRRVVGDELQDALARRRQLLVGGPAVARPMRHAPGLHLLAQAGDADLEELVEVAGEDRQEPDPLQQRVARVAGLVEDPGVELEPGELAVEVGELAPSPWRLDVGARVPRFVRVRLDRRLPWRLDGLLDAQPGRNGTRRARIARPVADPDPPNGLRRSRLGAVPPLAARRIDPDAHRGRSSSDRRTARRSAGSAAPSAGRWARRRQVRRRAATRRRSAER